MVVCFFTKPSKEEFMNYIQPTIARTGVRPVVDFEDKFLFVKVNAIYVQALNPSLQDGRPVAGGGKEEYIGAFKKFWKVNQNQ